MLDPAQVRLQIVLALIPVASRHGITSGDEITNRASQIEKYVLSSETKDEGIPDSSTHGGKKRSGKQATGEAANVESDPDS